MTNLRNLPDPWLENQLARLIRAASEREVGPGLQKIQDDLLAYVAATRDPRFVPGPPLCEMCAPSGECHTGGCPGGGYLAEAPPEPTAPLRPRLAADDPVDDEAERRLPFYSAEPPAEQDFRHLYHCEVASKAVLQCEIDSLKADVHAVQNAAETLEALKTAHQALLEVAHAQDVGPEWYTRGASGLRQQVGMWVRRGLDALNKARPSENRGDKP